jgi:tellurite methyltransferase
VKRILVGFHPDELGDWVAELDCLHNQHVRHDPPWQERPWVRTELGRSSRLGSPIDCPLCDRAEMPDGLVTVRTAGPFTADTLPSGLRRAHRVAARTWGRLVVLEGSATITIDTDPSMERTCSAGQAQAIPPEVPHAVVTAGSVRLIVQFLRPGE